MTDDAQDRALLIGAWLDGELSEADAALLEAEAAADPELAQEMQALKDQNVDLFLAFDALLEAPIPEAVTRSALDAPAPAPSPANRPWAPLRSFGTIAATLAVALIGVGGSAYVTRTYFPTTEIVQVQPGWMAQVAAYHRVYARQGRHLVEVPATEKEHIETWLGKETGVDFQVPDLSPAGFSFEGGRLLVAGDQPVLQLLYRDETGAVLALCALQSAREADGFETRQFGDDVTMVRWASSGADWVAVGTPKTDLQSVAELARADI